MAPKFGTSGLRGLVTDLTDDLVSRHVRAFVAGCDAGASVLVGHDLRASSPGLAATVAGALASMGRRVLICGAVPTPALALAAAGRQAGAVMVTGSHIPADRNGLKFYTAGGAEITKADEAAMLDALDAGPAEAGGTITELTDVAAAYEERYLIAFGRTALRGLAIGVYGHSAVGRDILARVIEGVGGTVHRLGWSDTFIPVDTEAVDPETRRLIADWTRAHGLDAVVSTDGDSDRPLLADETGRIVPGDILGQITARMIGARNVVTPVSSNSGVEISGAFERVERTRIGSPYVIAGMEAVGGDVAGYEANGGFLLGFEAQGPAGPLPPLMTRDCTLPILSVLAAAREAGAVSTLAGREPPRATAADRLQEVPVERAAALAEGLASDAGRRAAFLSPLGLEENGVDTTDGARMRASDGTILHVRPSGNAPELRLYVESDDPGRSADLLAAGLERLQAMLA